MRNKVFSLLSKGILFLLLGLFLEASFAYFFAGGITLDLLHARVDLLNSLHDSRPIAFTLLFIFVYLSIAALSTPGAAVMTLASGAFSGILFGTIISCFSACVAATIAMLLVRHLFHERLNNQFKAAI